MRNPSGLSTILSGGTRWASITALAILGSLLAPSLGSATDEIELSLAGDWRIQAAFAAQGGERVVTTVEVPAPQWRTVTAEPHASLPLFNPQAGGWGKGARLPALVAQECTTAFLLDPASLVVRASPDATATPLVAGRDYDADLTWGTVGRLAGGSIRDGQQVFISYRHGWLRLDSIVLTTNRQIELRVGVAQAAAPAPPVLRAGERRLANVWLPGVLPRLEPPNLFPIREPAFPEPAAESPTPAERFVPRAVAKLRAGGHLRVLAWGDSVTDGGYLPGGKNERWQEQFVARLRERFPAAQIELLTEAWGGRNTGSYLAEPPGSEHNYAEKVLARKPDLIISEFVNDAGLNEQQVESHYRRFLDDFRAIGAEWILLTPHYVRPDWMGLKAERDIDADPRPYVAGLRQFADRHNIALADASRRYGRLWRQGIPYSTLLLNSINHPNAAGMRLFADSLLALFPPAETRSAAAWEFNHDGDLEGWHANGDLAEVRVAGGALQLRGTGPDPILEYQGSLDLLAEPWDVLEVRLKADRDGDAEFFWSNTTQGRYGGFSQDKSTRFPVRGDQQWHTYRLRPFWHPDKRIVRLRFDLYDATRFEVDSLRVVKSPPVPTRSADFNFAQDAQNWRGEEGLVLCATNHCLVATLNQAAGMAIAPAVSFAAEDCTYVCLRLAADRGRHATLYFASADYPGLHSLAFPIRADGREHTYNLDLLSSPHWRGKMIALALRPTDEPGATARLQWLRVAAAPQGEPELAVRSFGIEEFPARAGHPVTLAARIANDGGTTLTNIRATAHLPAEVRVVGNQITSVTSLEPGAETTLRWPVRAKKPVAGEAALAARAANAPEVTATERLNFTATPPGAKRGYVPVPKPVRGPFEVGVYYFPGWPSASQWQPIQKFPERRPVLGWYREGDPEVADWHIKWAVEHGITFFIYDWYWVRGARQLEHGLHDGYFKARYRSLLKFCLLWANHNPPDTSSREDCLAVTRFWIQNYFRQPEHVMVDGKPMVVIFAPERLTQDLHPGQVRPVLDAMRAECVKAGLPGLYLVARVNSAAEARQAAVEGYDAVTSYTWPHLGVPAGEFRAPYATVLEGYRRQWQHILDTADIPLLPPVCGGWDSRPWHGENNFIRFDRTPELFRQHLADARQFLEVNTANPRRRGMLIVEAWNEWGEGAYIEPHTEFGFGYLDAIRAALTGASEPHVDIAPVDVGRGPYDVPLPPAPATAWEFQRDAGGWRSLMNVELRAVTNGCLQLHTLAVDPAIISAPLQVRASEFHKLRVRLRLVPDQANPANHGPGQGQVYWSTDRFAESSATGVGFSVPTDGTWQELEIDLASNPRWRGRITRLRFDPCEQANVRVEIDWLRLAP